MSSNPSDHSLTVTSGEEVTLTKADLEESGGALTRIQNQDGSVTLIVSQGSVLAWIYRHAADLEDQLWQAENERPSEAGDA